MPKTEGPIIKLTASCFDCKYCETITDTVEDGNDIDTSYSQYCKQPSIGRKYISGNWETPKWCPLIKQNINEFISKM